MDDKGIIALFFERSEQAIAELMNKYGTLCIRTAYNIVGDQSDAEECVSDANLALWNTIPPQEPDPLVAYMLRIVKNLSLKKLRDNSAKKRRSGYDAALDELSELIPSPETVEGTADARLLGETINQFLGTLEREERILFVRRYWFGDSVSDLAELFDTGSHSISVRLHRIRKRLKKQLEREGVSL